MEPIRFLILDGSAQEMSCFKVQKAAFVAIWVGMALTVAASVATIFLAFRDLFTFCRKDILSLKSLAVAGAFLASIPLSVFTIFAPRIGLQTSKIYSTFLFGLSEKMNGKKLDLQFFSLQPFFT